MALLFSMQRILLLRPAMDPNPFDDLPTAAGDLPCPQAMLVGTLALMSAWAHPAEGCQLDSNQRRPLLARKIISNLFFLQQHPLCSPPLRALAGRLHQQWVNGRGLDGVADTARHQAEDGLAPDAAAGLPSRQHWH